MENAENVEKHRGQNRHHLQSIPHDINPIIAYIVCILSCSVVSNSLRPAGLDCQTPLSMEFSRQEY